MPLYRTTGGKILRTGSSVARECCCVNPCEGRPTTDVVVEISHSQYLAYINGGTWNISISATLAEESDNGGFHETGSGSSSGSGSDDASGCNHSASADGTGTTRYTSEYPPPDGTTEDVPFNTSGTLTVQLGHEDGTYFLGFSATVWNWSTHEVSGSYGNNGTATVDGHEATLYSNWTDPGWAGRDNYENTSSATLLASFTPDAP